MILFILTGYCASYNNGEVSVLGPHDSFSILEMCIDVPVMNTVITTSACEILTMTKQEFTKILVQYPEVHEDMKKAKEFLNKNLSYHVESMPVDDVLITNNNEEKNIYYFNRGKKTEERLRKEYEVSFPKWALPLKYVLLPITISPCSHICFYWDCSRYIFAFLNCLLIPINMMSTCNDCIGWYIRMFLDFAAYVDIYYRHHICYYNKNNIEVRHPFYTAMNYWKHGLLIDILFVFPTDTVFSFFSNQRILLMLRFNRMFQVYRMFGLIRYVYESTLTLSVFWVLVKFLTFVVITVNCLSCIMFNISCIYEANVLHCAKNTWLKNISLTLADEKHLYMYNVFLVSGIFNNTHFSIIFTNSFVEKIFLVITAILGYLYWCRITVSVVALYSDVNNNLLRYQNAIKELTIFMNYKKIEKKLKNEVLFHFEYVWRKKQGKDINNIIKIFPNGFQQNLLFNLFGHVMLQSKMFSLCDRSVIQNLLLCGKHEIILKAGVIYKVNDVLNHMYFLVKGIVEVIGPDENHLQYLSVGSMFGNLDNCEYSRQTLTMAGHGHIELLKFNSLQFHEIFLKFPRAFKLFMRQTCLNVDFIENKQEISESYIKNINSDSQQTLRGTVQLWYKIVTVLSYVSYFFELYQLTTKEHGTLIVTVLYLLDFVHLMNILLKFFAAYEDEFGLVVTDRKLIVKNYREQIFGCYYDIICNIPLELFVLIFIEFDLKTTWSIWSLFRFNRLIRIAVVIKYYYELLNKLTVSIFLIRTTYIFLIISIVQVTMASILFYVESFYINIEEMSSMDKLIKFFNDTKLMINMMIKSRLNFHVERVNFSTITLMILMMVVSRLTSIVLLAEIVATTHIINKDRYVI